MTMLNARTTVRQTGIRQRSLRRTCRLGRATELVFIMATGTVLTLSGTAQAEVKTWDGSNGANGSN
jgi:fibronectin-binding autotransporter adhesin